MAGIDIDGLGVSLAKIFQAHDGLKVFLQELIQVVMQSEAAEHLQADWHERSPTSPVNARIFFSGHEIRVAASGRGGEREKRHVVKTKLPLGLW